MKITSKNYDQYEYILNHYRANLEKINQVVFEALKIENKNTRVREFCHARQVAAYMGFKYTVAPLATIGYFIGGLDHGTINHSISTVKNETERYDENRKELNRVSFRLEKLGFKKVVREDSRVINKKLELEQRPVKKVYKMFEKRFSQVV